MITSKRKFEKSVHGAAIAGLVIMGCFAANASAQTRAALVRDTDNAALAPATLCMGVRGNTYVSLGTVPAGRRFVVQNVSYFSEFTGSSSIQGGSLAGNAGSKLLIPVHPVHTATAGADSFQDASFQATAYFEAGDTISATFSTYGSAAPIVYLCVAGFYVTP